MTTALKFSIVIPTRERAVTLRHTLRTCVEQTYAPLEIVVSDNLSADDTREVVESFGDARIRYVNPGRRISMTRNWEFGLGHVTGDYVTFIGDDDGLLPDAVSDVAKLIAAYGVEAVSWEKAQFCWPNHPLPDYPGVMSLPLATRLFDCDARAFARDCATFWTAYAKGPCLYNAFVSMPVLSAIRARSDGAFFHSVIPDVYSSMAAASGIQRYLYSSRPFSVNGASGRSSGANIDSFLSKGSQPADATNMFVDETDLPLHPRMPVMIMGSVVALALEAILQANDRCFGGALPVDVDRTLRKAVKEVVASPAERYDSVRDQLLDVTRDDPPAQRAVRKALERYPNRPVRRAPPPRGLGADEIFWTNVTDLGIADVYAATRFVHGLLGSYAPPAKVGRYAHSSKIFSRGFAEARRRFDSHFW